MLIINGRDIRNGSFEMESLPQESYGNWIWEVIFKYEFGFENESFEGKIVFGGTVIGSNSKGPFL